MGKDSGKSMRGGARSGAGRPRGEAQNKLYSFRATEEMARYIDAQSGKTAFIRKCIASEMASSGADFSRLGAAFPATAVRGMDIPFFDVGIVAGFPVPLDNEEKAERIELLRMLCPHPESSYLIRVEGNSMIDAGIHSGDIVIVDKSCRNPSPSQIAVCELNGEYTLKRFEKRNGVGWLIPANPDYPEIKVTKDDAFCIWGTVTYIIHKPYNH